MLNISKQMKRVQNCIVEIINLIYVMKKRITCLSEFINRNSEYLEDIKESNYIFLLLVYT